MTYFIMVITITVLPFGHTRVTLQLRVQITTKHVCGKCYFKRSHKKVRNVDNILFILQGTAEGVSLMLQFSGTDPKVYNLGILRHCE